MKKKIALTAAFTILVSTAFSTPSYASQEQLEIKTKVVQFSKEDIKIVPEEEISNNSELSEKRNIYINRAEAEERRVLRNLDVKIAVGIKDGEKITIAMKNTDEIDYAQIKVSEDRHQQKRYGIGAIITDHDEKASTETRDKAPIGGGGREVRFSCRDIWFAGPSSMKSDFAVRDCYQKMAARSNNIGWVYNRFSRITPPKAEKNGLRVEITDFTVRYREWKTRNRINLGPYSSIPIPSENCNQQSFGIGAYGFSVTIPFMSCMNNIKVQEVGEQAQTIVEWRGSTSRQINVDGASAYRVIPGMEPIMSDYVYAEAKLCKLWDAPCFPGMPLKYMKWTDGGWSQ